MPENLIVSIGFYLTYLDSIQISYVLFCSFSKDKKELVIKSIGNK